MSFSFKLLNSVFREKTFDGWYSWDPAPWKHPWLNTENLQEIKEFSKDFLEKEKKSLHFQDPKALRVGFCGNIANCMYVRAVPLRKVDMDVNIFIHPHDQYVMSHPVWEEFYGTVSGKGLTLTELKEQNANLPDVKKVYQLPISNAMKAKAMPDWKVRNKNSDLRFLRKDSLGVFSDYLCNINTLVALQDMDVLWATQQVYLAYLANKSYVVSQMGGDIWFEASRGDVLGLLMRKSFANARVFLVSNPWSFAHARRFGFKHLVYLPKIIDQEIYSPGRGETRTKWDETSKGDFYVLTSSRLDERNKGSSIGIKGFAAFSKHYPNARLILIGWGNDKEKEMKLLDEYGISGKTIMMPVSGKALIRDYLKSADVFIDQFVLGYFGSAGMEAMACGLPVIGRIETDQYEALSETGAPPILNSQTEVEVFNHLVNLYNNKIYKKECADKHRKWFCENHGSARWLPEYKAVLTATANNLKTSFTHSPLAKRLDSVEKKYHKESLEQAPEFPNYGW